MSGFQETLMFRPKILSTILVAIALGAAALAIGQGVVLGKSSPAAPQVLRLTAKAGKFNDVNPTLEVRSGTPVEIVIRNEEPGSIPHDFRLVGLEVKPSQVLQPGESTTLRFTPSRPGEFAYTCSLHPGLMDGRLIVRP
jgi:plastocyanin